MKINIDTVHAKLKGILVLMLLLSSVLVKAQAPYHGGSGDGYAMAEVKNVVLGIESTTDIQQKVNLYPNPAKASANLEITCSKSMAFSVEIINLLGQKVFAGSYTSTRATIPLATCKPGSYIVHVQGGNTSYIQKLVITEP